jgi:hypothetical protein
LYAFGLALLLAIVFGFFGVTFFPPLHTMLSSVNVSETQPLVQFIVRGSPYFILFIIIYTIIMMVKNRVNK